MIEEILKYLVTAESSVTSTLVTLGIPHEVATWWLVLPLLLVAFLLVWLPSSRSTWGVPHPGERAHDRPLQSFDPPLKSASRDSAIHETRSPARLDERLGKARNGLFGRIRTLFQQPSLEQKALFDALEEVLISSDLGAETSEALLSLLRAEVPRGGTILEDDARRILHHELVNRLGAKDEIHFNESSLEGGPLVYLMVGINGVGKTTTTAKLGVKFQDAGKRVLLVAADTFRAGAVAQLQEWGTRFNLDVSQGAEGSKPSTVAYEGVARAVAEQYDVVIIDTAGRLHNRQNLMQELHGVQNAVRKVVPHAPYATFLVVDGASGQNALTQAREFNAVIPLSGVIVTKLDGTAKGGIVVSLVQELKIPVKAIGVGEGVEDLRAFDPAEYVEALLGERPDKVASAHAAQREARHAAG
jgi:fused signal recognition particle receptor